jgi:hypothetical protein
MMEQSELELSPKRDRLATVVGLIGETESQIKRLATAYAEAENDVVAESLKAELRNAGKKLDALRDESARLEAEIGMGKLLPDEVAAIKELSRTRIAPAGLVRSLLWTVQRLGRGLWSALNSEIGSIGTGGEPAGRPGRRRL